jgi:membrane-associated phospholipid phosphatase
MENLYDLGIWIINTLQGAAPWLQRPMEFFSFLGSEQFFLFVLPVLYWCLDRSLGIRVGMVLLFGSSLNSLLKLVFHGPRPFWYTRDVNAYAFESTFGIPSGHAQNSVVWGVLADRIKGSWAWGLALLAVFFIGLSRVFLAVHFPQDVLVGWVIGFLFLWIYLRIETPVKEWLGRLSPGRQILAALVASLALTAAGGLARLSLGDFVLPVEWVENAKAAFPEEEITPLSLDGLLTSTGVLFGFGAGLAWLKAHGGMDVGGAWWWRVLRFVIGVAGVFVLWAGLGAVFPEGETLLAYALRYIRYSLVGFWVAGVAPMIFVRLHLANPRSD